MLFDGKNDFPLRKKTFFPYFIVLFLISDFITKILIIYNFHPFFRLGAFIKSTLLFYVLLSLFRYRVKITKPFFVFIMVLGTSFIVSISLFGLDLSTKESLYNGYYLIRYLYPILVLSVIPRINEKDISLGIKLFLVFILLNAVLLIFGFLLEIKLFESYYNGIRFGYSGLLLYHAEAGYIYFIAIMIVYFKFRQKPKKFYALLGLLILFSMFISGTKKSIGLALIFCLFLIIENRSFLLEKIKTVLVLLLMLFGPIILFKNEILETITDKFNVLFNVYNKEGFLTALFSYRDQNLTSKIIPFVQKNWSVMNWVIGGPSFKDFRAEMEIIDLILFFGLLGVLTYIFVFIKIREYFYSEYLLFLTITLLLTSAASGNFLASINSFIIYIFAILYFHYESKLTKLQT